MSITICDTHLVRTVRYLSLTFEPVYFEMVDGNPTFKEAKEVFICKKLYVGKLEKEHFLMPEIYEKNYPLDDLHYVYIGEITDVYSKK